MSNCNSMSPSLPRTDLNSIICTDMNFFLPSSIRDENEVAMCIKDLNSPSFHPSMISIWVADSFERKDIERDLLTKLLINLAKPRDGMITEDQLIKGYELVD